MYLKNLKHSCLFQCVFCAHSKQMINSQRLNKVYNLLKKHNVTITDKNILLSINHF